MFAGFIPSAQFCHSHDCCCLQKTQTVVVVRPIGGDLVRYLGGDEVGALAPKIFFAIPSKMWNLGGRWGTHCIHEFQYLTHGFCVYIVDFVDFNIEPDRFWLAACYSIHFQAWSVNFCHYKWQPPFYNYTNTCNRLTQSVNEPFTFW